MKCIFFTFDASHFDTSQLKAFALENMLLMSVTFDTSHFERSPANDIPFPNMPTTVLTLDVSSSRGHY